ncbi:MAG TPA: EAL domain-containing protein [Micavibrio sp.]|nr:EAL domain-containing protein [Micavibrio sp.]HIL28498.1 EAL domain-containing protein [Micavibrio sp.]
MADKGSLKEQRDRFLAFSFASADLFLELDDAKKIVFALGAAKSLTGIDPEQLEGKYWLDILAEECHPHAIRLLKGAKDAVRKGPIKIRMTETLANGCEAILTAIKMPDNKNIYLTIGFATEVMQQLAEIVSENEKAELMDKQSFLHAAQEAFDHARTIGADAELTMFEFPRTTEIKEVLGAELWDQLTETITDVLTMSSIDGYSAAIVEEGKYSFIHDHSVNPDDIREQLTQLSKDKDPNGEGFDIQAKTVTAELESLSERETTKALVYTINEFERKGADFNIETLNTGFKAYVSANAQKIHEFKTAIEQLNFNLTFQPIVDLQAKTVSHFEILSKFKKGESTQEWIIFGEDIGMAADFDMAVVERVLNYLRYKGANNSMTFSMNLSGQSMQNEQFFKTLMAKLELHPNLAKRMIFEITESSTIKELELVNHFIKQLQTAGFKVCLDDFGAGAASFKSIQQLHVDFVKLDGQYTRRILSSHRDQIMVKNLVQMCADLHVPVIAEQLETIEHVDKMLELGVDMGQGYYFGYPLSNPAYDPDKLPAKPQK